MEHNDLTIKRPKEAPLLNQLALGVVVLLPLGYLLLQWRRDDPIHFASPILNLLACVALIIFPVIWITVFLKQKISFVDGEEQKSIGVPPWAARLLQSPPLVLGIFFLVQTAKDVVAHPEAVSISAPAALFFEVLLTALLALYGLLFLSPDYIRLAPQGIWLGLTRFVPWDDIAFIVIKSRQAELYHKQVPKVPLSEFTLISNEALSSLEKAVAEHKIPSRPIKNLWSSLMTLLWVIGGLAIITAGIWTERAHGTEPPWVVLGALAAMFGLSYVVSHVFGIHRVPHKLPIIEPLRVVEITPYSQTDVINPGRLTLTLLNGWTDITDQIPDKTLTFAHFGTGKRHMFAISQIPANRPARIDANPEGLREEAIDIGQQLGFERLSASSRGDVPFGAFGTAQFEGKDENTYFRIWILSNRRHVVMVTHMFPVTENEGLTEELEGMIRSITSD